MVTSRWVRRSCSSFLILHVDIERNDNLVVSAATRHAPSSLCALLDLPALYIRTEVGEQ